MPSNTGCGNLGVNKLLVQPDQHVRQDQEREQTDTEPPENCICHVNSPPLQSRARRSARCTENPARRCRTFRLPMCRRHLSDKRSSALPQRSIHQRPFYIVFSNSVHPLRHVAILLDLRSSCCGITDFSVHENLALRLRRGVFPVRSLLDRMTAIRLQGNMREACSRRLLNR